MNLLLTSGEAATSRSTPKEVASAVLSQSKSIPQMDDQLERLVEPMRQFIKHHAESHVEANDLYAALWALRSYLSEDTKRLDWLDATTRLEIDDGDNGPNSSRGIWGYVWCVEGECETVRDAIDKARQSGGTDV